MRRMGLLLLAFCLTVGMTTSFGCGGAEETTPPAETPEGDGGAGGEEAPAE